jgi:hypothetical protein
MLPRVPLNLEKVEAVRECEFTQIRPARLVLSCFECGTDQCKKLYLLGLDNCGNDLPFLRRPRCCADTRQGKPCGNRVVPGKRKCRMHGGLSTGPKTAEGKKRIAEAQRAKWERFRSNVSVPTR